MKALYSFLCNICATDWPKPDKNLYLLDLCKKTDVQDSLTGNFWGNAVRCNTAVQDAQHGYYCEESLQEKIQMAWEHSQSSSLFPALTPSWQIFSPPIWKKMSLAWTHVNAALPRSSAFKWWLLAQTWVSQKRQKGHYCQQGPLEDSSVHYLQTEYNQRMGVTKVPSFSTDSSVEQKLFQPQHFCTCSPVRNKIIKGRSSSIFFWGRNRTESKR